MSIMIIVTQLDESDLLAGHFPFSFTAQEVIDIGIMSCSSHDESIL